MSWFKKQYPVGRELEDYPSSVGGNSPARVTGYITHANLNNGEKKVSVTVRVRAKNEKGEEVIVFEDFDPALLDL